MDSSLFPSYSRLHYVYNYNRQVSSVFKHIAISARGLGSVTGPVKADTMSLTIRHRCDVFMLPSHFFKSFVSVI